MSLGEQDVSDVASEQEHFQKVVDAFLFYRSYALTGLTRVQNNFSVISPSHQIMLSYIPGHLERIKEAIEVNQRFVESITTSAVGMFENSQVSTLEVKTLHMTPPSLFDMTKVVTTIKQFYRDWSKEGAAEREVCYLPIVKEVLKQFPLDKCDPRNVSILVPGSGLGRLAYELAHCGYTCQGNEFSMYMLLGSNFILNQSAGVHAHMIHPWVHQFSNVKSRDHQLATVTVPDVDPSDLPQLGLFSMAAGDFLQVYASPNEWSCITCCFFIDTAHNILDYLERIYQILKPGGIWINFGPLLYHYAEMAEERSMELTWVDLRRIISQEIGFEIIKEDQDMPSHYIQNPHSMLKMTYDCVFLVAKKPLIHATHRETSTELHSKASELKYATTGCQGVDAMSHNSIQTSMQ